MNRKWILPLAIGCGVLCLIAAVVAGVGGAVFWGWLMEEPENIGINVDTPVMATMGETFILQVNIENLAKLQLLPREIALIVDLDPTEFEDEMLLQTGEKYRRYMRGKLKAEAEVRQSIYDMARQGSSPAQKQMMDIISRNQSFLPDTEE